MTFYKILLFDKFKFLKIFISYFNCFRNIYTYPLEFFNSLKILNNIQPLPVPISKMENLLFLKILQFFQPLVQSQV